MHKRQTRDIGDIGVHGKVPALLKHWSGRLIAFCDGEGFARAIGIVQGWDGKGRLRCIAPWFDQRDLASIQVGMKVEASASRTVFHDRDRL